MVDVNQNLQKEPYVLKTHLLKKECHNPKVGEILANTEWMVGECWEMGRVMKEVRDMSLSFRFQESCQKKANIL